MLLWDRLTDSQPTATGTISQEKRGIWGYMSEVLVHDQPLCLWLTHRGEAKPFTTSPGNKREEEDRAYNSFLEHAPGNPETSLRLLPTPVTTNVGTNPRKTHASLKSHMYAQFIYRVVR